MKCSGEFKGTTDLPFLNAIVILCKPMNCLPTAVLFIEVCEFVSSPSMFGHSGLLVREQSLRLKKSNMSQYMNLVGFCCQGRSVFTNGWNLSLIPF